MLVATAGHFAPRTICRKHLVGTLQLTFSAIYVPFVKSIGRFVRGQGIVNPLILIWRWSLLQLSKQWNHQVSSNKMLLLRCFFSVQHLFQGCTSFIYLILSKLPGYLLTFCFKTIMREVFNLILDCMMTYLISCFDLQFM